jgi:hypothetical protein
MGREAAEDRMALIAACLLRLTGARVDEATPARDSLPWALRVPVMLLDARDLWRAGHARLAGQHAADLVALAQGSQLGRDLIDARLLLGGILVDLGDESQALSVFLVALEESVARGMPLRAADALDALAYLGSRRSIPGVEQWWGAAAEVRSSRAAVAWGGAARFRAGVSVRGCPEGWIRHGEVMNACLDVVRGAVVGSVDGKAAPVPPNPGTGWLLETLTKAELTVADLVAEGLTSRQIAERLFISPRTAASSIWATSTTSTASAPRPAWRSARRRSEIMTRQNGQPMAIRSAPVADGLLGAVHVDPRPELLLHPHAGTTGAAAEGLLPERSISRSSTPGSAPMSSRGGA